MGSPQRTAKRAAERAKMKSHPSRFIASPANHPLYKLALKALAIENIAKAAAKKPSFSHRGPSPKTKPRPVTSKAIRPARAGNARVPGYRFRSNKKH